MQKFLSKPIPASSASGNGSGTIIDVTAPSNGIDLSTCTAKTLIDSTLEGVPLSAKMQTLCNLQTLIQECSSYLAELVKIESKRLVVDSRYLWIFTYSYHAWCITFLFQRSCMPCRKHHSKHNAPTLATTAHLIIECHVCIHCYI